MAAVSRIHGEPDRPTPDAGGGGGDGTGSRLAAVERQVAALNARMDYVSTKEDIQKLKVWVLLGVFAAIVFGIGTALGIAKLIP